MYVGISHLKPEGNHLVADRLFDILQKAAVATPARQEVAPASRRLSGGRPRPPVIKGNPKVLNYVQDSCTL